MRLLILLLLLPTGSLFAQGDYANIKDAASEINDQVIEWRRHFHEYPELSNREFETARYVDARLRELNIETRTGVAHTGVIGILKGGKPGGVVALRADMDGLPVTERADLPFASKAIGEYRGEEVGVMHACGHDTHVAMLLGAAKILSERRADIPGTIIFLFQPAEEGVPDGEEGGAKMMVKEGALSDYGVETAFGIHINSQTPVGTVKYKPGGAMAASSPFEIKVKGKQAHGSRPWAGVDPITAAAQIIIGLQTIVSRQVDLTNEAAVITVGKIEGGVRSNIIPEECTLIGTIRTLDRDMKQDIYARIERTAKSIAESSGATAEVTIREGTLVTYNDPELTEQMLPTMRATFGADKVVLSKAITGAEDFSYYAAEVPSLFVFVGGMDPEDTDAAGHHTPDFRIDERGLTYGVQLYVNMAMDWLAARSAR